VPPARAVAKNVSHFLPPIHSSYWIPRAGGARDAGSDACICSSSVESSRVRCLDASWTVSGLPRDQISTHEQADAVVDSAKLLAFNCMPRCTVAALSLHRFSARLYRTIMQTRSQSAHKRAVLTTFAVLGVVPAASWARMVSAPEASETATQIRRGDLISIPPRHSPQGQLVNPRGSVDPLIAPLPAARRRLPELRRARRSVHEVASRTGKT
jgi:hypothetical protein